MFKVKQLVSGRAVVIPGGLTPGTQPFREGRRPPYRARPLLDLTGLPAACFSAHCSPGDISLLLETL